MAESIEQWIGRQIREVDENGAATRTILLSAGDGGQTWDRWSAPFREEEGGIGAVELARLIDEVVQGAAEEWPAKKTHQIMLTALDSSGVERARFLKSVKGKSATANGAVLASESVAHAQAMKAHAETTAHLLAMSNAQNALAYKTIEMQGTQLQAALELLTQSRLSSALQAPENPGVVDAQINALNKFTENLPAILNIAGDFARRKGT